jgi:hypothetical protein
MMSPIGNFKQYFGSYYFMGFVLEVKQIGEKLVAAVPGVPEGYEIIFEPIEGDQFRNRGGLIDGSTVTFLRDETNRVMVLKAGQFELVKIDPQDIGDLPVVERLLPPPYSLTPEKQTQFERLLKASLERVDGGWIDYDLPYPKHEFVQYIMQQDIIIFHGSNIKDIETFQPVRKSMEFMDETGRGNVAGVYGTHDGLWSIFFAIIHRESLEGSIRNGVVYFHNQDGEQLPVYNFSINQDQLGEVPVTDGALYLLPRDTFVRLKLIEDSYANEWVSESPVKPYARLLLHPEDFPFLNQISGHDDGVLIRSGAISQQIRTAAVSASLVGDHFEVAIPNDSGAAELLDKYIAIQKIIMPAAIFEVQESGGFLKLIVTSLPAAVAHIVREDYTDLFEQE